MKFKKLLPALLFILGVILYCSPSVFPRAGAGHKYQPPAQETEVEPPRETRPAETRPQERYTPERRPDAGGSVDSHRQDREDGERTGSGVNCGGFIVFLFIVFILIVLMSKKKGGSSGTQQPLKIATVNVKDLKPIDEAKVKEQLDTLKQKDPHFSEKVFIDKAQTAFFEIQRAWSKNDLSPVRKNMSESQFNRMNMQVSEYKDKGWTNKIEDLVIGKVYIVEAGIEGEFDFIKTRIHASMSDKTYDDKGNIVEGGKEIIPVVEYWNFIRKQGAKTNQDGGRTVSHNCPSCGAPVDAGESGKCSYCDAVLSAGSFDWVLDTIIQPQEEMS